MIKIKFSIYLKVPNLSSGITAGLLDGNSVNIPILLAAIDQLDESNVLNVPSVLVNNKPHRDGPDAR